MDASFRKEKSEHGYKLDVLKSGLQKYIRRGNVEMALYCLRELDYFHKLGDTRDTKRIRTNMVHRLLIIFMEDIGIGGYNLLPIVVRLWKDWENSKRTKFDKLIQMVCLMCNAKKTRACSFVRAWKRKSSFQMTAGISFRQAVESKDWSSIFLLLDGLQNQTKKSVYDSYWIEMKKYNLVFMDECQSLYKEVKCRERFLTLLLPLVAHLFGFENSDEHIVDIEEIEDIEIPEGVVEFDDYVYDKHTKDGRNNEETKGTGFFVNVSSKVNNEVFIIPKEMRDAYFTYP